MRILRSIDDQFWLGVARRCEYATFFHTPFWHRLAVRTYPGYRDATIGAELENGVRIVFPLLRTGRPLRGLFQDFVSSFAGCYGGLIADGPVTISERRQLFQAVLDQDRIGQLRITGNPLAGDGGNPDHLDIREDFTHLLRLDDGYDTVFRNFTKGHRSATIKGKRDGVKIRLALTENDFQAYYGAYRDSLRRWGDNATSRYPWRLFQNGYCLGQEFPEHLKLWLAELDGEVIAGAWVFYWNRHAVWWHGAAYEESFPYKPANVLQADIIEDACEHGYRYYDFNPSGGHEGVARFKRSFGAQERPIRRWSYKNPKLQVARKLIHVFRRPVSGGDVEFANRVRDAGFE